MFQYPENPQQPPKPLPTWGFLCQITCFLQTPHLTASSLLHKNSRGAGAESRPSLALPLSSVSALVHREPREEAEQEAEAIRSCSKLGGTGGGGRGAPPPRPGTRYTLRQEKHRALTPYWLSWSLGPLFIYQPAAWGQTLAAPQRPPQWAGGERRGNARRGCPQKARRKRRGRLRTP